MGVVGGFGFDTVDAGVGAEGAGGDGAAAGEPAAAETDEEGVPGAGLGVGFEGGGAGSGDDVGVVVRGDEGETAFGAELLAEGLARGFVAVVEDDVGSVGLGGFALRGGCVGGHDDGDFDVGVAAGEGECLGVVAAGVGEDTGLALGGGELEDSVGCAAELEAAGALEGLGLEEDGGSGSFVQGAGGKDGG